MSLIAEETINLIREKTNIVDIVSDYVTLKKAGRTYKGICPFHKEKTPSFSIDVQKQLYHCFGCSEGGDVINFVRKIETLDFVEAIELLAKKTGVSINYSDDGKSNRAQGQKERFYQLNMEAANYYHYLLMKSDEGFVAREYLKGRLYDQNIVEKFKLGYAPLSKHSLINYLVKKGYKQQEISNLDLAYVSANQSKDRFINRIMFPIEDARGNYVGFGGRSLSDKDIPKYLNSSQTPVFHKSWQFYGLNFAKSDIVTKDKVIIVEGYTDVISLHKGGINNTVATLGTALTEHHIEILARFCSSAVMLFDSDDAGIKAAKRAIEFNNLTNMELLVAVLPEGDPADFINEKGKEELEKVINNSIGIVEFCLRQLVEGADLTTPEKRFLIISKAFELIKSQQNVILEQEYLQKFAKLSGIDLYGLKTEYRKKVNYGQQGVVQTKRITVDEKAEKLLLAILLEKPELIGKCLEIVEEINFVDELNENIFKLLQKSTQKSVAQLITETTDVKLKNHLSALSFINKPDDLENTLIDVSKKIKDIAINKQINAMKVVLEGTNPVQKRDEYDKLFKQLIELEAKRRNLKKVLNNL